MKKFIISIVFLLFVSKSYATPITVDQFITPDDVSITHLEDFRTKAVNAINSVDGANLQDGSITTSKLDANANPENRWKESFNNYVYTGLLPPTSASLSSTTTSGTAYVSGVRVVKDATSHTYSGSMWTFVDLSSTGTYSYPDIVIGASEPAVTANSIRLCRVSTDSSTVSGVRDDRQLSIAVAVDDNYRQDMAITGVPTASIIISPGIVYHGTIRIKKTASITLNIGTASDWVNGVSQRNISTYGFVVVDSAGNLKFTTTAPTKADTSGNTNGRLRYSVVSNIYYRVIGWFYMNANGSGNIDICQWGNFRDGVFNTVLISGDTDITLTTNNIFIPMQSLTMDYYSSGNPLYIDFTAPLSTDANSAYANYSINIDGIDVITGNNGGIDAGTIKKAFTGHLSYFGYHPQGTHTVLVMWRITPSGGAIYQSGASAGKRVLRIREE